MKRILFSLWTCLLSITLMWAQPSASYYTSSTLDGKSGQTLELALKAIIYPHTQVDYDDLWTSYKTTDPGPADSIPSGYSKTDLVYDMYAWMQQFPKFYSDKDHTQTGGFNREHSVPNSWWGGETGNSIAYSDLHHLTPADGAANNAKSNWPLGEYEAGMTLAWPTADKTNSSGVTYVTKANPASHVWKVSNSSNYGGATEVFEPADEYKGDFARMYLYVVCAYEGELTWKTNYMFTTGTNGYTTIKDWAKELLLKWHRQDPVSDKERDRNNAVYSLQNNRNPFIDYPYLVEYIWGDQSTATDLSISSLTSAYSDDYKNGNTGYETSNLESASMSVEIHLNVGDVCDRLSLSTTGDGAVTYSSSDTSVATVNAQTGVITALKAGTTIITATTAETDLYASSTETITIVVE